MGLFLTSPTNRHGVFARLVNPPVAVRTFPNSCVGIVGQFPWGPKDTVVNGDDLADVYRTFAPLGMSRTGSAMTGLANFGFPQRRIVRVLGTAAAKATVTINKTGPTALLVVTAKYEGVAGNSIVATTAAASDGDANHFKLTVTVSNAYGSTTEIYDNLNVSGTGSDVLPDVTNSALLGSVTKSSSGVPIMQAWSLATGADGTIDAAAYTGTAGTGDKGIALLESDLTVRHVITDDPGNSLRASVNAGLKAHAELMGDRIAHISYNSGTAVATVQTDAASYVSENVVYADVWAYVYDLTKTKVLVPAHFATACLASNLSPSTSPAWRDATARAFIGNIIALEATRTSSAGTNTDLGIATLIPYVGGGFALEAGVLTINRTTPSKGDITRTAMNIYIATAALAALQSYVDAPNVAKNQDACDAVVDGFMAGLKAQASQEPNTNPFVVDYELIPRKTMNSAADIANGQYSIGLNAQYGASMGQIILQIQGGKTVVIVRPDT